MHRSLFALVICLLLALPASRAEEARTLSIIRVNVTNQAWDFARPWGKRPPYSRRAVGTVLEGGRVLVTAELVANANYVEFETPEGGRKVPATVDVVDYEANLAILKTDDAEFLKPVKPLEVAPAAVGDTLAVWQLEATGNLLVTKATLTTAEVTRYPVDDSPLLIYRLTTPLQFRDSSFTLPVVKDGKLVGLVMRYDTNTNNADLIPAPVIQHFLTDAAKPPYKGFPRSGITSAQTRDPQFRRYIGLTGQTGGIYVTDTVPGGPAALAGVEKGDVILKIDGESVDQDGNYKDPDYGKISISHLFSTRHFDGETLKITVVRKGETKDLDLKLAHRPVESYVIEPYIFDRAPSFYILGGLVLGELSRQYLKEFGGDWMKKAPEQFVYFDRQQGELFKDGPKKIVFLNRVLPSDLTVGYEELAHLVVKKINGVALQSLADIPDALTKATNGLHRIEFDGEPGTIYLDAALVSASEVAFKQKYRLPTLQRLE
ncbi:MAG: PDZ domain-containing protein [Chthoniobacter sp.]|nr:PDZ domain-containing protein [Chthoniobacter sp.]